jgi:hypothetical protein
VTQGSRAFGAPVGQRLKEGRVKNDERDARGPADLSRLGRLVEAWIAPPGAADVNRTSSSPSPDDRWFAVGSETETHADGRFPGVRLEGESNLGVVSCWLDVESHIDLLVSRCHGEHDG